MTNTSDSYPDGYHPPHTIAPEDFYRQEQDASQLEFARLGNLLCDTLATMRWQAGSLDELVSELNSTRRESIELHVLAARIEFIEPHPNRESGWLGASLEYVESFFNTED